MHRRNGSATLELMQSACARPCYETLASLHDRLEEIADSLCALYPGKDRFPAMVERLRAARVHLLAAQSAANRGDMRGFEAAKGALAESLSDLAPPDLDLSGWQMP